MWCDISFLFQFDPEGFGEIPVDEFLNALKSPDLQTQVPLNKREILYERAMNAKEPKGSGYVSFQEFINVVSSTLISFQKYSTLQKIQYNFRVCSKVLCFYFFLWLADKKQKKMEKAYKEIMANLNLLNHVIWLFFYSR